MHIIIGFFNNFKWYDIFLLILCWLLIIRMSTIFSSQTIALESWPYIIGFGGTYSRMQAIKLSVEKWKVQRKKKNKKTHYEKLILTKLMAEITDCFSLDHLQPVMHNVILAFCITNHLQLCAIFWCKMAFWYKSE